MLEHTWRAGWDLTEEQAAAVAQGLGCPQPLGHVSVTCGNCGRDYQSAVGEPCVGAQLSASEITARRKGLA